MTENMNNGWSQRDSAEHEGYAKASRSFNRIWKERDSAQPKLLEAILYKDNFNRAYKRVKANKGTHGVDGMTVEEALPYLREHQKELTERILKGKYTPSPVRRVAIPKPDGGVRKLGIPTVIDRIIQQAIAQQLMPINKCAYKKYCPTKGCFVKNHCKNKSIHKPDKLSCIMTKISAGMYETHKTEIDEIMRRRNG